MALDQEIAGSVGDCMTVLLWKEEDDDVLDVFESVCIAS